MTELLVLSPHLDDAVLSCGRLLACRRGAVAATLFPGRPSPASLTDWDRTCGFPDADTAVATRRDEDRSALESLGATAVHCEILDRVNPRGEGWEEKLVARIKSLVAEFNPGVLATPLGLFHQDHVAVRTAVLKVVAPDFNGRWLLYEDLPYARREGAAAENERARDEFARAGYALEAADVELAPDFDAKLAAIYCYASQIRGMGYGSEEQIRATFAVERYWRPAAGTLRCQDPRLVARRATGAKMPEAIQRQADGEKRLKRPAVGLLNRSGLAPREGSRYSPTRYHWERQWKELTEEERYGKSG